MPQVSYDKEKKALTAKRDLHSAVWREACTPLLKQVLRAARDNRQMTLDVHSLIQLDVDQFHGIEIEEFPAQIAQVALWLTDHQMNMKVGEEFGLYFARIPLTSAPQVVHGNALALDWAESVSLARAPFIEPNVSRLSFLMKMWPRHMWPRGTMGSHTCSHTFSLAFSHLLLPSPALCRPLSPSTATCA